MKLRAFADTILAVFSIVILADAIILMRSTLVFEEFGLSIPASWIGFSLFASATIGSLFLGFAINDLSRGDGNKKITW